MLDEWSHSQCMDTPEYSEVAAKVRGHKIDQNQQPVAGTSNLPASKTKKKVFPPCLRKSSFQYRDRRALLQSCGDNSRRVLRPRVGRQWNKYTLVKHKNSPPDKPQCSTKTRHTDIRCCALFQRDDCRPQRAPSGFIIESRDSGLGSSQWRSTSISSPSHGFTTIYAIFSRITYSFKRIRSAGES